MPRPQNCRRIAQEPPCPVFKPAGVRARSREAVVLTLDELESLRLADLEGLYQETAAGFMGVSRQTFGRIVDKARHKTAQALILGRALKIEGGAVALSETRRLICRRCQHSWELPLESDRPGDCPHCKGKVDQRTGGECPCRGTGRARKCGGHRCGQA